MDSSDSGERVRIGKRYFIEKNCKHCGKPFYTRVDKQNIYCSKDCFGKSIRKDKRTICPQCGKEFEKRRKTQVFCSQICGARSHGKQVTIVCDFCGKPFSRVPRKVKTKKCYCSKQCAANGNRQRKGEEAPRWKGGIYHNDGYTFRRIKDGGFKYRGEHRLVMERYLGRPLESNEIVHHIDGDKANNDINNLQLVTRAEHVRIHRADLLRGKGLA